MRISYLFRLPSLPSFGTLLTAATLLLAICGTLMLVGCCGYTAEKPPAPTAPLGSGFILTLHM
jgi:hypothetical protein